MNRISYSLSSREKFITDRRTTIEMKIKSFRFHSTFGEFIRMEHLEIRFSFQESVLDQSTDQNEQEQPEDDEENPCEQISPEDLQRIESEKKKFDSAVSTLDKALENLENLSLQNVSRNENEVFVYDTHILTVNQLFS